MGYHTIATSRGTSKKELALELGAHEYLDSEAHDLAEELQKKGGAKLAVAVAPSGNAISSLIPTLGVDGQLLVLAVSDDLTIPVGGSSPSRRLTSAAADYTPSSQHP